MTEAKLPKVELPVEVTWWEGRAKLLERQVTRVPLGRKDKGGPRYLTNPPGPCMCTQVYGVLGIYLFVCDFWCNMIGNTDTCMYIYLHTFGPRRICSIFGEPKTFFSWCVALACPARWAVRWLVQHGDRTTVLQSHRNDRLEPWVKDLARRWNLDGSVKLRPSTAPKRSSATRVREGAVVS